MHVHSQPHDLRGLTFGGMVADVAAYAHGRWFDWRDARRARRRDDYINRRYRLCRRGEGWHGDLALLGAIVVVALGTGALLVWNLSGAWPRVLP